MYFLSARAELHRGLLISGQVKYLLPAYPLVINLFCSAVHLETHHATLSWAISVRVNLTSVSQAKLPLNWPQKSMWSETEAICHGFHLIKEKKSHYINQSVTLGNNAISPKQESARPA